MSPIVFIFRQCIVLMALMVLSSYGQRHAQSYPDPRTDITLCRNTEPASVCDPDGILSDSDRLALNRKIRDLLATTVATRNTSPHCQRGNTKPLQLLIAIVNKIHINQPITSSDMEKFANNLKKRYVHFQDGGLCDTTVLIVSSRKDAQVYTVAGRDTKLSKDALKNAFQNNLAIFQRNDFAQGLDGIVSDIVHAYQLAHKPEIIKATTSKESPQFQRNFNGVKTNIEEQQDDDDDSTNYEESDELWFDLFKLTTLRCGENGDPRRFMRHLQDVVDETLDLSLKLISDKRYAQIEEEVQYLKVNDTKLKPIERREMAWNKVGSVFVDRLMTKFRRRLDDEKPLSERRTSLCPKNTSPHNVDI